MIIVHGGAGTIDPERHATLRASVRAAATAGHELIARGASALDAVVAATRILEDDPELSAGTGSALTRDGTVETDAAVMDGATQRIGAVAAVPELGNAIALARAVLDANEHVLLVGPAAWAFADTVGIAPALPGALVTERARTRLAEHRAARTREREGGTVGAVARDHHGNVAAATSTGGMVGKRPGRVGDSPLAGAGTWADARVAVSATGDGEAIIRVALAHDLALRVRAGSTLADAMRASLAELAIVTGGSAGVIAIDASGPLFLQLSETMPVAWSDAAGVIHDALGEHFVPGQ
ncbi:MAG: isoaspartyl peptidase/L-asparaginase [Kofleriaceae bacterium]|nr:isoaspartyl peptidase/L-asparaginase [Kofleriaceae bacterium]